MQFASPSPGFQLALVQLPGRMRRARKLFRKLTGLTAVTSVATSLPEPGAPFALSPPVHPICARMLRSTANAPCGEQWLIHLRSSRRSRRTHTHTCPIGMRCSCVPIHLDDQLVGVAKLVVDAGTPEPAFMAAVGVLKLAVSDTCRDSAVAVLSEEVRALRQHVSELRQIQAPARPQRSGSPAPTIESGETTTDTRSAALVDRALAHLQRHYRDPRLSLRAVARAAECNPRYLTTRFTQIVGEHMHTFLIALRVSHACRLLMGTDSSVKEIAYASGFSGPGRLASAFRSYVGISPAEYRRVFAKP